MICLLEGHLPRRYDGKGAFSGQRFEVCVHCGKTWPVINGEPAPDAIEPPRERLAG